MDATPANYTVIDANGNRHQPCQICHYMQIWLSPTCVECGA